MLMMATSFGTSGTRVQLSFRDGRGKVAFDPLAADLPTIDPSRQGDAAVRHPWDQSNVNLVTMVHEPFSFLQDVGFCASGKDGVRGGACDVFSEDRAEVDVVGSKLIDRWVGGGRA